MARWAALLIFAALCRAQNPLAGDPQAAETGRWTFRILCAPCHGIHADGGRGPDLTLGSYSNGDRDQDLYNVIAHGVAGSEMAGYADRLDAPSIWRLVSYVRSVARKETGAVHGDAAAGEEYFWGAGGCGKCHRVGSRGSGIGPDLSRAGRQRSLSYLRASVIHPDADVTPGYGTVRVVMRDGSSIVGVERNVDNFSAQLIELSGKYHSFVIEDVKSIAREARSLMPSYEKTLKAAELDNLLAYLASLRGEQ